MNLGGKAVLLGGQVTASAGKRLRFSYFRTNTRTAENTRGGLCSKQTACRAIHPHFLPPLAGNDRRRRSTAVVSLIGRANARG